MSWSLIGSVVMALAVVIGAFGGHALRAKLDEDGLRRWDIGLRWHLVHGLGLFAVALVGRGASGGDEALLAAAGWLMVAGLALFSGSLYALALSGRRWLGAITPLGGAAWIVAWSLLAVVASTGGVG